MSNQKVVYGRKEFLSMFDDNGVPKEPFTIGMNQEINQLELVTSLKGVGFEPGSTMSTLGGLRNLKTLDGFKFTPGVELSYLNSITTMEGICLPEYVEIHGLTKLKSFSGLLLSEGVCLHGLVSIDSFDTLDLCDNVTLTDLNNVKEIRGLYTARNCIIRGVGFSIG